MSIPLVTTQRRSPSSTLRRYSVRLLEHVVERVYQGLESERKRFMEAGSSQYVFSYVETASVHRRELQIRTLSDELSQSTHISLSSEELDVLCDLVATVALQRHRPVTIALLHGAERLRNRVALIDSPAVYTYGNYQHVLWRLESYIGPIDLKHVLNAL